MAAFDALTKCHRCGAQYDAGVRWYAGYWHGDMSPTAKGRFVAHSSISMGNCPFCREPPHLEPAQQRVVM